MRPLAYLLAMVLVVYTLATALTLVQPGERAVVRRFGRVLADKPGPGLFWGLPWGLDRVDRVPAERVRRLLVGYAENGEDDPDVLPAGQLLTGDHNLVNVQAEISYRVNEAEVEKFVLQADRVDVFVARAAETLLAEWVAGRTIDDVLLRGKVLLPAHMQEQLQERLRAYDLGVEIGAVSVTQLSPPEAVKDAFDRLAQAQTEIRTRVYRAEQEADRQQREAETDVYRMQRLASAYAREQHLQATAEAESFTRRLEQYRKLDRDHPNYLNTLWLDEMGRLYARMQQAGRLDVLDHVLSSEGLNITQFPLQKKK